MTEEERALIKMMHATDARHTGQINTFDVVLLMMIQELDQRLPGFRHSCLERVSAYFATLPSAEGAALAVRQQMMDHAEDLLRG